MGPGYTTRRLSLFLDVALLRDIHTVQELADVLLPCEACLVDKSGHTSNVGKRVAFENNLILHTRVTYARDSCGKLDDTHALLAEVVTELDLLLGDVQVDGEVAVDEAHLVAESLRDSCDHVLRVANDGAHHCKLLSLAVPQLHGELVVRHIDVRLDVFEICRQLA